MMPQDKDKIGYTTHFVDPEVLGQIVVKAQREGHLKVTDAAKYLQLHPQTILAKIRKGHLQGFLVGKRYHVTLDELDRWLRDGDL